jgi:hypothetical protein
MPLLDAVCQILVETVEEQGGGERWLTRWT